MVIDDEGRVQSLNPAAEALLGRSSAELVGCRVTELTHPDDRRESERVRVRWLEEGARHPLIHESRVVGHDGSARHLAWVMACVRSSNGQACAVVAQGRDVTPQYRQAQDNASSQLRLRSVVAGLLDPVVTIDDHGIVLFASDSVRSVFGYTPEELVGRNVTMLMPEPHRSHHDQYLARYRETGETWILNTTREYEALRKTGGRVWVEISVARIDVPGQERPLFCGSFRDITARKQAESALRQSEARFRAIFDQEFQLVGLLAPSGTVLEMNRAALESAGLRRAEVIGRPFWETPWWSGTPQLRELCRELVAAAARGEFVRQQVDFPTSGGDVRAVDYSLKPIRGDDGEVILLLPEGRDVTELRRAQARETSMLKALATLGESASVLAHEIKNPITSINLALRAVADKLGEDERSVVEDLVGRMQKLEGKIRRTLSIAKPLDLELAPADVLPLLLGPVETLRDEAEARQIELELEVEPGTHAVLVDESVLDDLTTNLIRNAIDAVEDGGRIAVTARNAGERMVKITVEDDGPGVPENLLESLFKPFVTSKGDGTGLGLALARKIAEEHGGSLEVENGSALGGARFTTRLRRAID